MEDIDVTALLRLPLKFYQEEGVKWMLSREKGPAVSGVQGGILGDDMGLGKTIQMIAVILGNPAENVVYHAGALREEVHLQEGLTADNLKDLSLKDLTKAYIKKFPLVKPSGYSARTMASHIASIEVLELESQIRFPLSPWPAPSSAHISSITPLTPPARATLVVCPASCVNVWLDQIETHVAKDTLRVYAYRGGQRIRDKTFLEKQDIILVSYELLAREYKQLSEDSEASDDDDENADVVCSYTDMPFKDDGIHMTEKICKKEKSSSKVLKIDGDSSTGKVKGDEPSICDESDGPLLTDSGVLSVVFHRIVLDECHYIRNNTQTAKVVVNGLHGRLRWGMTGTLLFNRCEDYFHYFAFLRFEPLASRALFRKEVTSLVESRSAEAHEKGLAYLREQLNSLTLRREKSVVLAGVLPDRTIELVHLDMQEGSKQRLVYDAIYHSFRGILKILSRTKAGRKVISASYHHVLECIVRLRQCCNSHTLIKAERYAVAEEVLKAMRTRTIDVMEATNLLRRFKNVFCGKRRPDNNKEDEDEDDEDMLCCEICWESERDLFSLRSCPPNGECRLFCNECLVEELLEQPARCPLCNTAFTKEDMKPFARRNNHCDAHEGDDEDEDTGTGKGKPKRKGGHDKVPVKKRKTNISNSPKLESASSKCDSLKISSEPPAEVCDCPKAADLAERLRAMMSQEPTHKALVFSQFTKYLDIIETVLAKHNIPFQRLDGTMNQLTRKENLNEWRKPNPPRPNRPFHGSIILSSILSSTYNYKPKADVSSASSSAATTGTSSAANNTTNSTAAAAAYFSTPTAAFEDKHSSNLSYHKGKGNSSPYGPPVLLISTKAGGVGLTLTEANHVFLMEPQWNLASEDQAMDRCYRIGQSKDVTVIRYSMRPSIESPMMFLQTSKGALSHCSIKEKGMKMLKLAHRLHKVKLLFNISEKDVVDELEKMEEEGWHTLMEDA